jgi:putative colanic acid biosynthesis UDP-glucose lipid carrier transferase
MSLVGPRPHAAAHNEHYRGRVQAYMRRHALKPGITGWAQVLGLRGATETDAKMADRVRADLDYIRNWSLHLDLKILLMTVMRGRDRNAY